ncbi:MAG: hypothetical protein DWQ36_14820 [Acidobacteria bacterium]|nr:MAG: hypothetical protein DWQ36_14820 [Acidobacteriota bacterium]
MVRRAIRGDVDIQHGQFHTPSPALDAALRAPSRPEIRESIGHARCRPPISTGGRGRVGLFAEADVQTQGRGADEP